MILGNAGKLLDTDLCPKLQKAWDRIKGLLYASRRVLEKWLGHRSSPTVTAKRSLACVQTILDWKY